MSRSFKITHVRTTDPFTSRAGAADVAGRAPSQMLRLLMAYGQARAGLTDEQAGQEAGLHHYGATKRCADLRNKEWIAPLKILGTTLTRTGSSGSQQRVCYITEAGRKHLQQKGLA